MRVAAPKKALYKENVKRQVERAAEKYRERPDLSSWLYDLAGSTIPFRSAEEELAAMGSASVGGFTSMHAPPKCDVCGEERLVSFSCVSDS